MTVFGFFKVDKRRRILDAVEVDNPPVEIMAKGMWLDVPKEAMQILALRRLNVAAAIHAAEHALISLMPQFVVSMPGEAMQILALRRLNVAAAIHAAEHALISLMPQFVVSMPGDVRTE